jgi:7-cyano-7-deazaguanine synthase
VPLSQIGGSALVGDGAIPKDRPLEDGGIPSTYVPARNTVFLSLALAWAEVTGAGALVIGVNALDYSGYPDCRPEYLEAFERVAALATKAGVEGKPLRILAPLLHLSKADIIRRGVALGLDYGLTSSCYDPAPGGTPCGRCDSCRLRARGFAEAGVLDPALR